MSATIVAKFGKDQFYFGTDTVLTVGSGPADHIQVKHAGIGECHVRLKRRGDEVKVECNNTNGFFIQNQSMHLHVTTGYAFMKNTFDLHFGRSKNPNYEPGGPAHTYFIDAPNTTIKVVFTPAPVARAPSPAPVSKKRKVSFGTDSERLYKLND
jgi:hypothetical protein